MVGKKIFRLRILFEEIFDALILHFGTNLMHFLKHCKKKEENAREKVFFGRKKIKIEKIINIIRNKITNKNRRNKYN